MLSAEYIKKKLEQEMVLSQAFGRDLVSISFLLSLQAVQKTTFPQNTGFGETSMSLNLLY